MELRLVLVESTVKFAVKDVNIGINCMVAVNSRLYCARNHFCDVHYNRTCILNVGNMVVTPAFNKSSYLGYSMLFTNSKEQ